MDQNPRHDEHLTCNERLAARGLRKVFVGSPPRANVYRGNKLLFNGTACDVSAWISAGMPKDFEPPW